MDQIVICYVDNNNEGTKKLKHNVLRGCKGEGSTKQANKSYHFVRMNVFKCELECENSQSGKRLHHSYAFFFFSSDVELNDFHCFSRLQVKNEKC
ncbi:hypothetical protein POVCU2_0044390 [Plasmodium ovale curtisi]|uniref:Uncharacterized protein n=1 Tax=Plasmodium ovale curtisi TaxID=864141 RepID=A0A1A8WZM8_PLAOA|nr:hypothetical protein POVCU2_0044390 [Plasmodium ovale curtisi]SBS97798.1 hypothetical protein POVCU1_041080 [Plasmodium ovale curtisi]